MMIATTSNSLQNPSIKITLNMLVLTQNGTQNDPLSN